MTTNTTSTSDSLEKRLLAGTSPSSLAHSGEIEIAGHLYITESRLAETLSVTRRTIARWRAARVGPPRIKIGRLVLIPVEKLPNWIDSHEAADPVRVQARRGRLVR